MSVRRVVVAICLLLIIALLAVPPAHESSPAPAPTAAAAPAKGGTAASKPAAGSGSRAKESKSSLEKYEARLKTWFSILGLWIGALLVAAGVAILLIMLWKGRKPSLKIEAFGDTAIETKVGSVLSVMVQKRLSDLSARGRQGKGAYKLDVVVADVELLADNDNLETALSGLADSSQFKLVVALVGLVDRLIGRQLLAKGELAPPGDKGYGVVLSLQTQAKGIGATGSLWSGVPSRRPPPTDSNKPAPYYLLAEGSAAWIQYEAARSLKSNVDLITKSARSFSLLSEGLAQQRLNQIDAAMKFYADAIDDDPENVAALFNLSVILARYYGRYDWAVGLLGLARVALRKRYMEAEAR